MHAQVFKAPLELALEAYFEDKNIAVLENLFQCLNSIDMKAMPCPNRLQQSQLHREVDYFNSPTLFDDWTYHTSVSCFGTDVAVSVPFYRTPDEICSVSATRLVKTLGSAVMRVLHAILTRQRVLFIGYNHAAAGLLFAVSRDAVRDCSVVFSPLARPLTHMYERALTAVLHSLSAADLSK